MGKYNVIVSPKAMKQLREIHCSAPKAVIAKIERIFVELAEHPTTGIAKPEPMKGLPFTWSRRIDKKNRLVYAVEENIVTVTVASCLGHYDDK